MTWLKDEEPLREDEIESGHIRVNPNNTLIIHEPRRDDSGDYRCIVKTALDTIQRSAKIVVKDVPTTPQQASVTCIEGQRVVEVRD